MRRTSGRGTGRLLLFLLCGIIIGTILGHILSIYLDHPIFNKTLMLGTNEDYVTINLTVFSIILGFTLYVNFGTVIGVIIGLILYFRS
ncbi:MAG TPA: DUF4321 domain-containing protein [Clostridiales bacterium]|nr:DUF4321 domain-containing protein [Clostridiales bacterium]